MMPTPPFYKRITLVVADIERSLTLYRDILGFAINYLEPSDDDSFSYPVFNIPKHAKIKFGVLDSPTQERTFGLTEVKGCDLPKYEGIHMHASVINVSNLKETIKKIKALGLTATHEVTDNNDHYTFIEQAFTDFDGHLIVLYELLPN